MQRIALASKSNEEMQATAPSVTMVSELVTMVTCVNWLSEIGVEFLGLAVW